MPLPPLPPPLVYSRHYIIHPLAKTTAGIVIHNSSEYLTCFFPASPVNATTVAFAPGPTESVRDPPGARVCEPGNTKAPPELAVAVIFPTAIVLEDEIGLRVSLPRMIIERGASEIVP